MHWGRDESEEDQQNKLSLAEHFSAWGGYIQYIKDYRQKEDAELMERLQREHELDTKNCKYRILETCMHFWKLWLKKNSKKARERLAEVTEIETYVGGMRYMRSFKSRKPTESSTTESVVGRNIPQTLCWENRTPALAQIMHIPHLCKPDKLVEGTVKRQDRELLDYSMKMLRWAPKIAPYLRGGSLATSPALFSDEISTEKTKVSALTSKGRKPAFGSTEKRWEQQENRIEGASHKVHLIAAAKASNNHSGVNTQTATSTIYLSKTSYPRAPTGQKGTRTQSERGRRFKGR
jgi:hypothetical protein